LAREAVKGKAVSSVAVADELHMIFECPALQAVRQQKIKKKDFTRFCCSMRHRNTLVATQTGHSLECVRCEHHFFIST